MASFTRFIDDDEGADLIEYAMLAGLISLACVATLTLVATGINGLYTKIITQIGKVLP
jgi:pilus assembly protein Flp/PilA